MSGRQSIDVFLPLLLSPTFYYFLSFDLSPFAYIREGEREGEEVNLADRREKSPCS
jgi:hypothetical protein